MITVKPIYPSICEPCGQFCFTRDNERVCDIFGVFTVPLDAPNAHSRRENDYTVQFMEAWDQLVENGCKEIKYEHFTTGPIF